MKPTAHASPVPRSGGVSSFSCGFAIALTCLLLVTEVSISSGLPQKTGQNLDSYSETVVKWEIDPLLPKNFEKKKFLEANSEVPENPPDETNHFSFRDQQAAQPVLDPKLPSEQVPQIKGQDDTVKIVPTERESQATPAPISPPAQKPAKESPPAVNDPVQVTATGSKTDLEKGQAEDGSYSEKREEQDKESQNLALNRQQAQNDLSPMRPNQPRTKPNQQKRPKLSPELIQGPLMKTLSNAPRIGTVAIESRLHPYGVYLQKMLKAIEEQWHQLAFGSMRFIQKDRLPGTLTLRFTLLSTGRIKDLSRLDSEGSSLAAELCRQAIASRAPFGNWSEDMISDFGKFDEITISFTYR